MIVSGTILAVGTIFAAILLLLLTIAILSAGKSIDTHPKAVSKTAPSWSSPVPATRIFAGAYWIVFIIGCVLVLFGETRIGIVLGIASIFAAVLVASTGFLLSVSVIAALNKKRGVLTA
jgi:predicted lysophospholipase L1 biosynthesis ABC-type transport system permease subunit